MSNAIAIRYEPNGVVWYVREVRPSIYRGGRGDWGYVTDRSKATRLNQHQMAIFANDMVAVGRQYSFSSFSSGGN